MKLIKRFALLAIVMISIQVYGQSDTTSTQVDTIKIEEKLDTFYSYVFVPRHYIPFSKGRWTRVDSHWEIYDTLYLPSLVGPCPGEDDSEADLIFYIYSHETKSYSKFYHVPEHGKYHSLKKIIIQ